MMMRPASFAHRASPARRNHWCGAGATLLAMLEDDIDPIASTQMFRNFVARPEPAARRGPNPRVLAALVVLALLLGGVLVWLAVR